MEIELKYLIKNDFSLNKISEGLVSLNGANKDTFHIIDMEALYYDTMDFDLKKSGYAYRIRKENKDYLLTVKWDGKTKNGLHRREELNLAVDESLVKEPSIKPLIDSEVYDEMSKAIGKKVLSPFIRMEYLRKEITVDTGKSISVVSVDKGEIITKNGNVPISELEVELYSGDENDMLAFGEKLKMIYNLEPCDISKLKRGMNKLMEK